MGELGCLYNGLNLPGSGSNYLGKGHDGFRVRRKCVIEVEARKGVLIGYKIGYSLINSENETSAPGESSICGLSAGTGDFCGPSKLETTPMFPLTNLHLQNHHQQLSITDVAESVLG